ncbi:MAG TPA: methyltransferase domain-containing protein [Ktedonobacterales bacterium]|nr:methyltransferase domain-containing protein [Ktedonobacterales bacterium]
MTKKTRRRGQRSQPVRTARRADGRLALEVANVTQSVTLSADEAAPIPGYWPRMLPERCPERALLLGLGGGTLAALLARRCPGVSIVGIEHSAEVLAVARRDFGLDALSGLEMVEGDAFAWVEEHAASEPASYDLICLDLYDGGRLAPGTLARPFLRQVAALLRPDGVISVNLMSTKRFPEQLHRIEHVFTIQRQIRLWGNVVLHLSPPVSVPEEPTEPMPPPARSSRAVH